MIKNKFKVKGMKDILPKKLILWKIIINKIQNLFEKYGFKEINTPIIEKTILFNNNLDNNDINKEMYSFIDKNNLSLTLRPENTISVVKSVINNNLIQNKINKLWYYGPMFRHEKPQYGRYRQFYQIGIEAIGFYNIDIEIELINICNRIWKIFNLNNIYLELNSIGSIKERRRYNKDLLKYLKKKKIFLNKNIYKNPIKILDSKNINIIRLIKKFPILYNYLNDKSLIKFKKLRDILKKKNINFKINYNLVRGLDYYNNLVFEWINNNNLKKITFCAGGRYNLLFNKFYKKNIPSCGFAIGVDRLVNIIEYQKKIINKNRCDIYFIYTKKKFYIKSLILSEKLHNLGFKIILFCNLINEKFSLKSQIKLANLNNALFVIILGKKEIKKKFITIKNMKIKNNFLNKQIKLPYYKAINYLFKQIKFYKTLN